MKLKLKNFVLSASAVLIAWAAYRLGYHEGVIDAASEMSLAMNGYLEEYEAKKIMDTVKNLRA